MNNTTEQNYDELSDMIEKSDITNSKLPGIITLVCLLGAILFFVIIYLLTAKEI